MFFSCFFLVFLMVVQWFSYGFPVENSFSSRFCLLVLQLKTSFLQISSSGFAMKSSLSSTVFQVSDWKTTGFLSDVPSVCVGLQPFSNF